MYFGQIHLPFPSHLDFSSVSLQFFLPTSSALKKKRPESTDCCLHGMGVGSSPGAWVGSERPNPWVELTLPPAQAITPNSSSDSGGTSWALPHPCWNSFCLHLVHTLCMQLQLIWVHVCNALSCVINNVSWQRSAISGFYSLSMMISEPWWGDVIWMSYSELNIPQPCILCVLTRHEPLYSFPSPAESVSKGWMCVGPSQGFPSLPCIDCHEPRSLSRDSKPHCLPVCEKENTVTDL